MLDYFIKGFGLAVRLDIFAMVSFGLLGGMQVGALPGFTTLMAMSILLPISFFLDPVVGIPFLLGIYKGGIFGGSIPGDYVTAILLGAFVAQGLRPGPKLFEEQGATVYAILIAMVFANLIFLVIGYLSILFFRAFGHDQILNPDPARHHVCFCGCLCFPARSHRSNDAGWFWNFRNSRQRRKVRYHANGHGVHPWRGLRICLRANCRDVQQKRFEHFLDRTTGRFRYPGLHINHLRSSAATVPSSGRLSPTLGMRIAPEPVRKIRCDRGREKYANII